MSAVTLVRQVRLLVGAGGAKPGPAIGQALGPLGINMAEFCKQFNEVTKNHVKDVPMPVVLSAMSNRSFTFIVKTPPTSWFLKKCAGIQTGSARPGHDYVGSVHVKQVYEIATIKQTDEHLTDIPLQSLCRSIIGQATSMGIKIVANDDEALPQLVDPLSEKAGGKESDKKGAKNEKTDKKPAAAPPASKDKKAAPSTTDSKTAAPPSADKKSGSAPEKKPESGSSKKGK